jgi:hypothetical protein
VPQLPPRHRRLRAGAAIMTASEMPSSSLTRTRIKLDRPIDRELPCCDNVVSANTLYRARIHCTGCGRDRGWLSGTIIDFIEQVSRRFGAPSIITLKRNPSHVAGAGGEEHIHSATEGNVKMKRDEIFPSKYLKASDLSKPIVVTIDTAPLEVLKNPEGREQHKTVLYFKGAKKALPLNVSNWDTVAEICGEDTDDWPGGRIEPYATKTQMGGKMVDCIRVREPRDAAAKTATSPKPAAPEADDMDDAIPF